MWEMISYLAAFLVVMLLIELFDLPDWIRAYLNTGASRRQLEHKINALQLQVDELKRQVSKMAEE